MESAVVRRDIENGAYRLVPRAFAMGLAPRTITWRISAAADLASELDGDRGVLSPDSLGGRVLLAAGDSTAILDVLQTSEVVARIERRSGERPTEHLRTVYGLDDPAWRRRGLRPSARLAALLAADLVWMPFAHGLLLARDRTPASLRIDLRSVAATVWVWVSQDYPAVALALGAALTGPGGTRLPFGAFDTLLLRVLERHLGGSFAPEPDLDAAAMLSRNLAIDVASHLAEGKVSGLLSSALTGRMVSAVRMAFPHLRWSEDPVLTFETATAPLVLASIRDGSASDETMRMLDELRHGLGDHAT